MIEKLLLIALVLTTYSCSPSDEELMEQAAKYEQNGNYSQAIETLDEIINQSPDNLGAYINRGTYKSHLELFEEANEDYFAALKLDESNTMALFNLGVNYDELNNPSQARKYFIKAEVSMRNTVAWTVESFEPSESHDFDIPIHEIQHELGIIEEHLGNSHETIRCMTSSIEANFELEYSHYMLGHAYFQMGAPEKACESFRISADLGNLHAKELIKKYCDI
jgi:tetratricopeptide (TPR) repeat protein